jgi:hypothetical protein
MNARDWMAVGAALLAGISAMQGVQAQQVRGVVRDSAARTALAGAVVAVVDSGGATKARDITDANGRFVLPAVAGAARLHLVHIGFRPLDVALPARRDSIALAMSRLPNVLAAVKVSGQSLCPGEAERGSAFQLWDEARTALLATIVARDAKPAATTTITFESTMSPDDDRIRLQRKTVRHLRTTRPFAAYAAPSFFAQHGYMVEDAAGRLFNAPDADVLLDPSFAATHCFRARKADDEHRGEVGLAFVPAEGRDTLVDVAGVLWFDVGSVQLRSLEFQYTSLEPAAIEARAGGTIDFRTMPNGVSFIERWVLRLPSLQAVPNFSSTRRSADPVRRSERRDVRVSAVVESGGVVEDASWADGTVFHAMPAVIAGSVRRRDSGEPAFGAVVAIQGGVDSTRTDAAGAYRLTVLPGAYTVVATDTTLSAYASPRRAGREVVARPGLATTANFEVERLPKVLADVCHGIRLPDSAMVLVGRVTLASSAAAALRDAPGHLHATWQSDFQRSGGGVLGITNRQQIDLDGAGRFLVCGVARHQPVALHLTFDSGVSADTTVRPVAPGMIQSVSWRIGGAPRN